MKSPASTCSGPETHFSRTRGVMRRTSAVRVWAPDAREVISIVTGNPGSRSVVWRYSQRSARAGDPTKRESMKVDPFTPVMWIFPERTDAAGMRRKIEYLPAVVTVAFQRTLAESVAVTGADRNEAPQPLSVTVDHFPDD